VPSDAYVLGVTQPARQAALWGVLAASTRN